MLDHLRRPPALFQDVVLAHFSENGHEILKMAARWVAEAEAAEAAEKGREGPRPPHHDVGVSGSAAELRQAVAELTALLQPSFVSPGNGGHVLTLGERRWVGLAGVGLLLGTLAVGGIVVGAWSRRGRTGG